MSSRPNKSGEKRKLSASSPNKSGKPKSNTKTSSVSGKKRKAPDFDVNYNNEPDQTSSSKKAKPVFNFQKSKKFKVNFDSKKDSKYKNDTNDSKSKKSWKDQSEKEDDKKFSDEKRLWEILRKKDTPSDVRRITNNKLLSMIQGKIKHITFRHDISRIVQTCYKYATPEQKVRILGELKEHILELSKSHYGHFLVQKLLKYAPKKEIPHLIAIFRGQIKKLGRHKEASNIVEMLYKDICNAAQRNSLMQEFYAKKFAIFKVEEKMTLESLLESEPQRKEAIITYVQDTIDHLVNKGLVYHTYAQRLVAEFLQNAPYDKQLQVITTLTEAVLTILHTREGLKVALHSLGYGKAKDRKKIIKDLKGRVKALSQDSHGVLAIIRALDVTDDIVTTSLILSELKGDLEEIAEDKNGRQVILHLLSPHNKRYFNPDVLELLKPPTFTNAEGVTVPTSKKSPEFRQAEQLEQIERPLMDLLSNKGHSYLCSTQNAPIVVETLKSHLIETKLREECFRKICDHVFDTDKESEAETPNLLIDGVGHRYFKKLLLLESPDSQKSEAAESTIQIKTDSVKNPLPPYGNIFLQKLKPFIKKAAAHPNASFLVAALLSNPLTKNEVASLLKGLEKTLSNSEETGPRSVAALLGGTDLPKKKK